jgi:hypothetical protein
MKEGPHVSTKTIKPETTITDQRGDEYTYGGLQDGGLPGGCTISFGVAAGGLPVIRCEPEKVIPSAELPKLDKKDPRIEVANDKAGRPTSWGGNWRAQVPGDLSPYWHKTKTEAVTHAALRLAIRAWWA